MKVGNINPILFKGVQTVTKPTFEPTVNKEIKELDNVTPDFAVKVPQKYSKIRVTKLDNGLELHSYKLANGHKITIIPMEGSRATVKNYVNVGSINETDDIKGISHFLEHMAFNGTLGSEGYEKLELGDSFSKIEKLGGFANASTNFAITDYINSTPLLNDSDLETQIKVIAAMTEDLALTDEMIEKEKGPVCSEIDMILDSPSTVAIDQTIRTLFNIKSSADELVAGSVNHIKNLNRQKVKEYYDKYYTPDNMNLVITGDVNPDEVIELVAKNFHSNKTRQGKIYEEKLTPINKTVRKDFIFDNTSTADILIGFSGPKANNTKDKVLFLVVNEYINSSNSPLKKELKKYNSYPNLEQERISTNTNEPMLLLFSAGSSEDNLEKVLKVALTNLSKIEKPSEEQLANIKDWISQGKKEDMENSLYINNLVGHCVLENDLDYIENFEKILSSITPNDVSEYIKKYINIDKAVITVIHPQTTEEKIQANYNEVNNVSFKGKQRLPINTEKASQVTLPNNYKVAIQETKNDNFHYTLTLEHDAFKKDFNPAAIEILNYIFDMGNSSMDEDEFNDYEHKNIVSTGASISIDDLSVYGFCKKESIDKGLDLAKELLNSPRINEETFNEAIKKINDIINRSEIYADDLYLDYEAKNNPLVDTIEEIKEGLKTVTLDDVKNLHNYVVNNSMGSIVFNIPEGQTELKNHILAKFSEFNKVNEFNYETPAVYVPNTSPKVLTHSKPVSQADIMQVYKFKKVDSIKEKITRTLLTSILDSSKDIGLFNTLREKEHLAYSVYSDLGGGGDCSTLSCNILTTTDNKETGEVSYENVQRSIDGFHRQINALLNSEYSDEDIENAKNKLKASLLINESSTSKTAALISSAYWPEGLEFQNELYKMIDTITRDDIQELAKKVFANPPIYAIVASQNTLDANKEYFEKLEQA